LPAALGRRLVDIRLLGRLGVLVDGTEVLKALPEAGRRILGLLAIRGEHTEEAGDM
jgi:hypothetical protein